MRGAADLVMVPFGQEARRAALLPGDLLDRMLGDGVMVGAVERGA
jgi:hypothetical protein